MLVGHAAGALRWAFAACPVSPSAAGPQCRLGSPVHPTPLRRTETDHHCPVQCQVVGKQNGSHEVCGEKKNDSIIINNIRDDKDISHDQAIFCLVSDTWLVLAKASLHYG